jgi:hypothetical protein
MLSLKMSLSMGLCLAATAAIARPVDANLASDLAVSWLNNRSGGEQVVVRDVLTHEVNGTPGAYTVRFAPTGFVLMPADDAMAPVIGWSLVNEAPAFVNHPAVSSLLENIALEVQRVQAEGLTSSENTARWDAILSGAFSEPSRDQVVPPLMETEWDQGAGWNAYCPVAAGGPGGRVWVGCVATSMVQVMKYWNQPLEGNGSHSYYSNYGWLEVDYEGFEYDWAAMHNTQVTDAAAILSYHAAVAVDMDFNPDGSGAYVGWGNPSALTAMVDHFDYSNVISFEEKYGQSWQNWRIYLRAELDAGRPMIYRGTGSGGHAFNCDGYTDDDYFHFNWGWSGSYNGWFLITDLSPGMSDFSEDQGAIMNCQPVHWQRPPLVIAPASGADSVPCEPLEFTWEPATEALSYELMLDDNDDFSSPVFTEVELTECELSYEGLENYQNYYWKIRSSGPYGTGPWSPVANFTTEYWTSTPAPELATPVDAAVGISVNPTVFVWHTVEGGESYELQVSLAEDFSTIAFDSLGLVGHFTLVQGLEEESDYFWRTRCFGLAGDSEWSEIRSFATVLATGIDSPSLPQSMALNQNYPNPFNPTTHITWTQGVAASVNVTIVDLQGRRVEVLVDGWHAAGDHQILFDAVALPAGIYFAVLKSGSSQDVMKMTLLK